MTKRFLIILVMLFWYDVGFAGESRTLFQSKLGFEFDVSPKFVVETSEEKGQVKIDFKEDRGGSIMIMKIQFPSSYAVPTSTEQFEKETCDAVVTDYIGHVFKGYDLVSCGLSNITKFDSVYAIVQDEGFFKKHYLHNFTILHNGFGYMMGLSCATDSGCREKEYNILKTELKKIAESFDIN